MPDHVETWLERAISNFNFASISMANIEELEPDTFDVVFFNFVAERLHYCAECILREVLAANDLSYPEDDHELDVMLRLMEEEGIVPPFWVHMYTRSELLDAWVEKTPRLDYTVDPRKIDAVLEFLSSVIMFFQTGEYDMGDEDGSVCINSGDPEDCIGCPIYEDCEERQQREAKRDIGPLPDISDSDSGKKKPGRRNGSEDGFDTRKWPRFPD